MLQLANAVRPQSGGLELALTAARGGRQPPGAGALPRRGHPGPRDLRPGPGRPRGRHGPARPGGAGARGAPQRRAGGGAGGPRHPVREVRRAAVHRGRARQGLPGGRPDRRQSGRRRRLVPGAPAARGHRPGARPAVHRASCARPSPAPFDRWKDAVDAAPRRAREALAATIGGLAGAVAVEPAGERAAAILAALREPLRARYPDADIRLADLERLADAAASRPSLHDALVELALDPPVSASDLAGPPRQDEDFLVISTVHSAKGLEWPVVHLPHLVDGAVPSDMALSSPGRAGRGAAAVLRRGHPGPRPAVPVRAAAPAPPPAGQRRPAQLRPAEPVPRRPGAGRVRLRAGRAAAAAAPPHRGSWPRASTPISTRSGRGDPAQARPGPMSGGPRSPGPLRLGRRHRDVGAHRPVHRHGADPARPGGGGQPRRARVDARFVAVRGRRPLTSRMEGNGRPARLSGVPG